MNREQAEAFLKALGAKQIKSQASMGDWVQASCPLAPFTHKSHKDNNPSFGLNIAPGKPASFNCYACHSGSGAELLQSLEMYVQKAPGRVFPDFKTARQLLEAEEIELPSLPEYSEFSQGQQQQFEEWPSHWIQSFAPVTMNLEAHAYLRDKRRVPLQLIAEHDLRWDSHMRLVVFPYYNVYGKFAGARGRAIEDDNPIQHHDYKWKGRNNAALCWFNEQALQLDGPVVVVEGQFDCLRVLEGGWNKVVANLTAKPTPFKFKRLCQSEVILHIPDCDLPGEQSVAYYQKLAVLNNVAYRALKLPPPSDGSKLDPDLCHPQYLRDLIEDALKNP